MMAPINEKEQAKQASDQAPPAPPRVDLRSSRNSIKKTLRDVLDKLKKKAVDVVRQGMAQMTTLDSTVKEFSLKRTEYEDFILTVHERLRVVEAWSDGTVFASSDGTSFVRTVSAY